MRKALKGSITVYLSISLTIILGLLCTVVESGRDALLNARLQEVTYMAEDAVFSEYVASLFKEYGVMYLYKTPEKISKKIADYANFNMDPGQTPTSNLNLLKARTKKVNISEISFATDNGAASFIDQVSEYMKYNITDEVISELSTEANALQNGASENAVMVRGSEFSSETDAGNILDNIVGLINNCTLALVTDTGTVSNNRFDTSKFPSTTCDTKSSEDVSLIEKAALCQFAKSKFSNYLDGTTDKPINYEIEYLIGGKNTDDGNLAAVSKELIMLRSGLNFMYINTDAEKCEEAYTVATIIGAVTATPEFIEGIQKLLLLGWSYAEGIADVKALLAGKKVPLYKNAAEWKTSLVNILAPTFVSASEGSARGLDYEGYLRALLFMENSTNIAFREMDVIQENISKIEGKEFLFSRAISDISVDVEYESTEVFLSFGFVRRLIGKDSGYKKVITSQYSY